MLGHKQNKTRDLDQDIFRNIVSLRKSEDLFDDLTDGNAELSAFASSVEMRVKSGIPADIISRGFHYSTAINYPFETEHYMATRYGDGTFGVWYGALDIDTTIAETAYHMMKMELGIEGNNHIIIRERAVYNVHCRAILLDFSVERTHYAELAQEEYAFTQSLGKRLHYEGHPGLLAPSARCSGINTVIFNPNVLSNPRVHHYLIYKFDPRKKILNVEREPGKILTTITF